MSAAVAPERDGRPILRASQIVNFTAKQKVMWHAILTTRFVLYGGARGGGKSYFIRMAMLLLLLRWYGQGHANVRVGIFCETFEALKDRHLSKKYQIPAALGTWNLTDYEFRLHPAYGGGVICFRNLDNPDKYRSAEFAAIAVDELTLNDITVFNDLRGSLRWPGIDWTPFFAGSNPTGIGHTWVKDIFVDQTFELDEAKNLIEVDPQLGVAAFTKADFGYVKALPTDNPHNSPEYIRNLRSLPERIRQAFLYGSWDHYEGMAFEEWERNVHVVPNFRPPAGWRYVAGMDWGYRKGCYLLFALGPKGQKIIVWEAVLTKLTARKAARMIAERSAAFPAPEIIYADSQMWQQTGTADTLANEFQAGLIDAYGSLDAAPKLIPAAKEGLEKKGYRATKYIRMKDHLGFERAKDGTVPVWGQPRLLVMKRCVYFKRSIPALPVDPDMPEDDVDTNADDHGYDAACNVLMALPELPEERDESFSVNRHPGINPVLRRRRKRWVRDQEREEQALEGGLPSIMGTDQRGLVLVEDV